eukprot:s2_g17.t1
MSKQLEAFRNPSAENAHWQSQIVPGSSLFVEDDTGTVISKEHSCKLMDENCEHAIKRRIRAAVLAYCILGNPKPVDAQTSWCNTADLI